MLLGLYFTFWIILIVVIMVTYGIKNPFLRWIFILLPPLSLLLLMWVPIDLITTALWGPAMLAFVISIISIVYRLTCAYINKLKKKPPSPITLKIELIRPILVVLIFPTVFGITKLSQKSADIYAAKTAKNVQRMCNENGVCPEFIEGWEVGVESWYASSKLYGRYGSKYIIRYCIEDDPNGFTIIVRHNIDEGFYIYGGVGKTLQAEMSIEEDSTPVDINELIFD
jgi:hypothetical protein